MEEKMHKNSNIKNKKKNNEEEPDISLIKYIKFMLDKVVLLQSKDTDKWNRKKTPKKQFRNKGTLRQ